MSKESTQRDLIFLKLFLKAKAGEVSDEEARYFRDHPEQIDKLTAPVNVHLIFLWFGTLLGVGCVAASKLLKFSSALDFMSEAFGEFTIDIVFEIGVALIGASLSRKIRAAPLALRTGCGAGTQGVVLFQDAALGCQGLARWAG